PAPDLSCRASPPLQRGTSGSTEENMDSSMEPATQGVSRWRAAGGTLAGSLLGGILGIIAGISLVPGEVETVSGPLPVAVIGGVVGSVVWLVKALLIVAAGGLLGAIAGSVAGAVLGTRRSAGTSVPKTRGRKSAWFFFILSLVMLISGILDSGTTASHFILWTLLGSLTAWDLFGKRSRTT